MRYPLRLLSIFLFIQTAATAQVIQNVRASAEGDKVVVTYDINEAADGQKFKVRLYASHNNYASPLNQVSGDVGQNADLFPGTGKRIEWAAKSELKEFDGDITFEVRADVISTAVRITGPTLGAKYKKGKVLDIQWKGIGSSQMVKLELLKGGIPITQIGETSNRTNYTWIIPKSAEKGKDYQVKLTSNNISVVSDVFTVKSKTPMLVKILPIVVVGGAVAYIVTQGDDGGEPNPPVGGDPLPEPPGVPE